MLLTGPVVLTDIDLQCWRCPSSWASSLKLSRFSIYSFPQVWYLISLVVAFCFFLGRPSSATPAVVDFNHSWVMRLCRIYTTWSLLGPWGSKIQMYIYQFKWERQSLLEIVIHILRVSFCLSFACPEATLFDNFSMPAALRCRQSCDDYRRYNFHSSR